MNTTLQVRVDSKTKREAQKTLEAIGLTMSSGVKLFLTQVARTQSVPTEFFTIENLPEEKKKRLARELKREVAWALKHGKRYKNAKEMHDAIRKMS